MGFANMGALDKFKTSETTNIVPNLDSVFDNVTGPYAYDTKGVIKFSSTIEMPLMGHSAMRQYLLGYKAGGSEADRNLLLNRMDHELALGSVKGLQIAYSSFTTDGQLAVTQIFNSASALSQYKADADTKYGKLLEKFDKQSSDTTGTVYFDYVMNKIPRNVPGAMAWPDGARCAGHSQCSFGSGDDAMIFKMNAGTAGANAKTGSIEVSIKPNRDSTTAGMPIWSLQSQPQTWGNCFDDVSCTWQAAG